MNENSVITKTRRRKLCMAASDPEKPLAVITHVAFGNGGVNGSGEPLVPLETQTALNSELARYEVESVTYPAETTARYAVTIPKDALVARRSARQRWWTAMGMWWPSRPCTPRRRMKMSASPLSLTMNFNLEVTAHGRRVLHSPGKPGV